MCVFFLILSLKYRIVISCLSGIAASQDCNSPLWSLQIKNTAPFSFQPKLVCRIPGRGLWRVQKGDYGYQCAAVLPSTG